MYLIIPVGLMCMFRGAYRMYLFGIRQHSGFAKDGVNMVGGCLRERLVMLLHVCPLLGLLLGACFLGFLGSLLEWHFVEMRVCDTLGIIYGIIC